MSEPTTCKTCGEAHLAFRIMPDGSSHVAVDEATARRRALLTLRFKVRANARHGVASPNMTRRIADLEAEMSSLGEMAS